MANNGFTNEFQEKNIECKTWLDLFKLTIQKTKEQIHCGTLAKYKDIELPWSEDKGYGIAIFTPFPLTTNQQNFEIKAYFLNPPEEGKAKFVEGQICCIIFMDNNFVSCLTSGNIMKTNDTDLHSLSYGIVINTL